jgi:hypothetical protein
MFSFLKNHPFAVEAFFESSVVLTFAVPKDQLQHLIPECLELDTLNDKWAFLAVAMVQTKDLRPKGFPKLIGNDFFLIGYRIFVRFETTQGKKLRGLYILKSETDKSRMTFIGNIFTHYNYTTTDIHQKLDNTVIEINSFKSGLKIKFDFSGVENISVPAGSPFADWKEARRFAGPLPFTLTKINNRNEILVIEGVRQNWKPMPIHILDSDFSFINHLNLTGVTLANAFMIRSVPYYWKKGKTELWNKKEPSFRVS